MLLLAGNVRPLTSAPCGRRDLLTTGPGPDAGGSKPGKEGCDHMPEKSGMAARPAAGPAVCPKAGVCRTDPEAGRIPVSLKHLPLSSVVAGLVLAAPIMLALCLNVRVAGTSPAT